MSYFLSETIPNVKNAGNKARKDCKTIFKKANFTEIVFVDKNNKIKNLIEIIKLLKKVPKNELLYIQYPFVCRINWLFSYICKRKKTVVLIHDIDELRYQNDDNTLKKKFRVLNKANSIISQTPQMTKLMFNNGIPLSKIYTLNLFDYLLQKNEVDHINDQNLLCFSGDLGKSNFIYKIPQEIIKYGFDLYGIGLRKNELPLNMNYRGAYSPEIIPFKLKGKYGLVWDGDSINTCSGMIGNYLKYNDPHKLSMYIVANMPIIIWKEAAEAKLVKKYDIGLTVSSINEIPKVVGQISEKQYKQMQQNIKVLSEKISKGDFLTKQINLIENKN